MFNRSIQSMTENENIQLGFLIFPGFPMACLTSMIEPLRAANEIADTRSFAWTLISEDGGPVESSAAVAFHPNCTLVGAGHLDYLFLLSPPNGRFTDPRKGNGALRNRARHGATLGGRQRRCVSAGARGLAGWACDIGALVLRGGLWRRIPPTIAPPTMSSWWTVAA